MTLGLTITINDLEHALRSHGLELKLDFVLEWHASLWRRNTKVAEAKDVMMALAITKALGALDAPRTCCKCNKQVPHGEGHALPEGLVHQRCA